MPNSKFGYSVKKNSFKGLNIDCILYSNIIRITYYSYSYSGTILNPNIIRIRIRPNIFARILFVFVFPHFDKTNIIRIRIRSKFWFRILFVFGPKNSIRSPLHCIRLCHPNKIYLLLLIPCLLWDLTDMTLAKIHATSPCLTLQNLAKPNRLQVALCSKFWR